MGIPLQPGRQSLPRAVHPYAARALHGPAGAHPADLGHAADPRAGDDLQSHGLSRARRRGGMDAAQRSTGGSGRQEPDRHRTARRRHARVAAAAVAPRAVSHLSFHRPRRVRRQRAGRRADPRRGQGARPQGEQPVARHDAARPRNAARGDPERVRGRAHVAHGPVRRLGAEPRPAGHPGRDRHAVRDRRRCGQPVRARVLRGARGRVSDRRLAHRSPQVDLCRAARSRMGHAGPLHALARRPHLRGRYRRRRRSRSPPSRAGRRSSTRRRG